MSEIFTLSFAIPSFFPCRSERREGNESPSDNEVEVERRPMIADQDRTSRRFDVRRATNWQQEGIRIKELLRTVVIRNRLVHERPFDFIDHAQLVQLHNHICVSFHAWTALRGGSVWRHDPWQWQAIPRPTRKWNSIIFVEHRKAKERKDPAKARGRKDFRRKINPEAKAKERDWKAKRRKWQSDERKIRALKKTTISTRCDFLFLSSVFIHQFLYLQGKLQALYF